MKTITVSAKGQIALPKEIREALHIEAGSQLTSVIKDGKLILEPVVTIPQSQAWAWTPEWQKKIAASMEDVKKGRVRTFKSVAEMRKALGS
ncbi:MAG TPA: AbrB/MazE/SpoVT family DNA-binding domain-containing protein [Dissulfurispiraceae bacterium]|nr:AbrB/MazE/SpoVT family DNA-binding domain-containing protein [Dissulfurispiraceae bacterium]